MGPFFRVLFFMTILLALQGPLCLYADDAKTIKFDFKDDGRKWSIVLKDSNNQQSIVEYIPENTVLDKWTDIVTVQYIQGVNVVPKEYYERFIKSLKQNVPYNKVSDKVILDDPHSLFWEWWIADKSPTDQYEWIRVFVDGSNAAFLRYTTKDAKNAEQYGPIWEKIIKSATFDGEKPQESPEQGN